MGVEVTSEIESGAVVPAIPDRPQGENDNAHPWGRVGPWHGESFLNMGLDLASARFGGPTRMNRPPLKAWRSEALAGCCQRHGPHLGEKATAMAVPRSTSVVDFAARSNGKKET